MKVFLSLLLGVAALPVAASRLSLEGTIDDVITDEIDTQTSYLILKTASKRYYCGLRTDILRSLDTEALIDATVRVSGIPQAAGSGQRRHMDRLIVIASASDIQVLRPPLTDPFAAPSLSELQNAQADAIVLSGRRSIEGYVKAVWNDNILFVTTEIGESCLVYLHGGTTDRPAHGDFVRVVGLPETDLFHINLTRAFWKHVPPTFPLPDDMPADIADTDLFTASSGGNPSFRTGYSGKTVRLTGTVRRMSPDNASAETVYLECGGNEFAVIAARGKRPFSELSPGCTAKITCVGILHTGIWTYTDPIPRIRGYSFVVRNADDVVVLTRPPWWTPEKLLAAIAVLSLTLVVILIWNRVLQHVISRKSRQLLKEQVAQIKAALRVDERTHLAVELHDSLSQNLSGVACQIAATKGVLPEEATEATRYLGTAERMLLSCRTELRRCLWDLRSDTLEDENFAEAVLKTLAPVTLGVKAVVRFNVSRARLSDTTAHAVLCIIRELAANAIRHGQATTIRVAGELHDGELAFSVRDDGRGFDPAHCSGPAEGHFGLEGIRERVRRLNGSFEISPQPDRGMRAAITIRAVHPTKEPHP